MKFSVVIPTHNRLHLLRGAIETVRRQDGDWELAIFDNGSVDPVGEYVRSLNDSRIHCSRSDEFLPVTESWNRALSMARGDYVILLGDDDGLTPNYFHRVGDVIGPFERPDVIYTDFYQFWYRGVAPWQPEPHLLVVHHGYFFAGRDEPFELSREEAVHAVVGSLRLRINFSFNSQAFLYSRRFIERLKRQAPVFRSPFPDYYIANVALAKSRWTLVIPEPLAVAGVSKASYGYALYNNLEAKGDALLNANYVDDPIYQSVKSRLLPGRSYNTNFLLAMEYVARDTREEIGVEPDYERYRRMQILCMLQGHVTEQAKAWARTDLWARLSASEIVWALGVKAMLHARDRVSFVRPFVDAKLADIGSIVGVGPAPRHYGPNQCSSMVDVYEAFEAGSACAP